MNNHLKLNAFDDNFNNKMTVNIFMSIISWNILEHTVPDLMFM